ncbi:MAG: M23 family metallopeptidase [Ardenticatenaceae bacterium]
MANHQPLTNSDFLLQLLYDIKQLEKENQDLQLIIDYLETRPEGGTLPLAAQAAVIQKPQAANEQPSKIVNISGRKQSPLMPAGQVMKETLAIGLVERELPLAQEAILGTALTDPVANETIQSFSLPRNLFAPLAKIVNPFSGMSLEATKIQNIALVPLLSLLLSSPFLADFDSYLTERVADDKSEAVVARITTRLLLKDLVPSIEIEDASSVSPTEDTSHDSFSSVSLLPANIDGATDLLSRQANGKSEFLQLRFPQAVLSGDLLAGSSEVEAQAVQVGAKAANGKTELVQLRFPQAVISGDLLAGSSEFEAQTVPEGAKALVISGDLLASSSEVEAQAVQVGAKAANGKTELVISGHLLVGSSEVEAQPVQKSSLPAELFWKSTPSLSLASSSYAPEIPFEQAEARSATEEPVGGADEWEATAFEASEAASKEVADDTSDAVVLAGSSEVEAEAVQEGAKAARGKTELVISGHLLAGSSEVEAQPVQKSSLPAELFWKSTPSLSPASSSYAPEISFEQAEALSVNVTEEAVGGADESKATGGEASEAASKEKATIAPKTYVVQPADTLWAISRRFGSSPKILIEANPELAPNPDLLIIGQTIMIPSNLEPSAPSVSTLESSADSDLPMVPSENLVQLNYSEGGVSHTIQAGDTLSNIAGQYGTTVQNIVASNRNLPHANTILLVGQPLSIPTGPVSPLAASSAPNPSSLASSNFIWPARGRITQQPSRTHMALDIAIVLGTPVLAADGGEVVRADFDSDGYGYYIVIDHGNGYRTLYAHLTSFEVEVGTSVSQGTVIGLSGSTGKSTGPHLHFEVRLHNQLQDPWKYLN